MEKLNPKDYEVYDAENQILGRIASTVAKKLIHSNQRIAIINSEKAIISGNPNKIQARYMVRLNLQEKSNPEHSPYWSRRPDMLLKRVVRGMLPYKKPSGKTAYRNLRVYLGVPEELKASKRVAMEVRDPKKIYTGYMTMQELSIMLGYDKT
jgi:large subunit ribosomal protein L13